MDERRQKQYTHFTMLQNLTLVFYTIRSKLAEVMDTTKGKGCVRTLTEMSERRNHRNIAGVATKG